jgi:hypothetical protein
VKAVLKEKYNAVNVYIKKKDMKSVALYLKELEKEGQNPKPIKGRK